MGRWPRAQDRFDPTRMSRHAWREGRRERIPIEMIAMAYEDPDDRRASTHDEWREIRTRWFGPRAVEVVVDTLDRRVVTVWQKGSDR
jgi:hypothetical protein